MSAAGVQRAALTALGRALGCPEPSMIMDKPRRASTIIDGLPERCYYSGPIEALGPAPPPRRPRPLSWGYMDLEASELAQRGRADIIQFVQMMRRVREQGSRLSRRRR